MKPEVTVLIALVTIAIAAILIVALFLGYRIIKRTYARTHTHVCTHLHTHMHTVSCFVKKQCSR